MPHGVNGSGSQSAGALRVLKNAPEPNRVHVPQPVVVTDQPHVHTEMAHPHPGDSGCAKLFACSVIPFNFMFRYTVPKTDANSTTCALMVSFCLVLVWLGVLTFVCVDAAEKMGNCLHINEDVMGLTLL